MTDSKINTLDVVKNLRRMQDTFPNSWTAETAKHAADLIEALLNERQAVKDVVNKKLNSLQGVMDKPMHEEARQRLNSDHQRIQSAAQSGRRETKK